MDLSRSFEDVFVCPQRDGWLSASADAMALDARTTPSQQL